MAKQFTGVPLAFCSLPGRPFPVASCFVSSCVSSDNHFWVLDKSPRSDPRRGPPSYNIRTPILSDESLTSLPHLILITSEIQPHQGQSFGPGIWWRHIHLVHNRGRFQSGRGNTWTSPPGILVPVPSFLPQGHPHSYLILISITGGSQPGSWVSALLPWCLESEVFQNTCHPGFPESVHHSTWEQRLVPGENYFYFIKSICSALFLSTALTLVLIFLKYEMPSSETHWASATFKRSNRFFELELHTRHCVEQWGKW